MKILDHYNLPHDILAVIGDILITMNAWQYADWTDRAKISDLIDRMRDDNLYIYIDDICGKLQQYVILPPNISEYQRWFMLMSFDSKKISILSRFGGNEYNILDLSALIWCVLNAPTILEDCYNRMEVII